METPVHDRQWVNWASVGLAVTIKKPPSAWSSLAVGDDGVRAVVTGLLGADMDALYARPDDDDFDCSGPELV